MVRVVEHHDGLSTGVLARDLHGVLDGFGAGVEQGRPLLVVTGGQAVEGLGDGDVAVVGGDREARVGEGSDLLGDRGDDTGVRVADARHGDARAQVDERVVVGVHHDPTTGSDDGDRHGDADPGRDGTGLPRHELA